MDKGRVNNKVKFDIFGFIFSLLIILSTGTIELFKDGGARDQGVINRVAYSGILNHLTTIWLIFLISYLFLYLWNRSGSLKISKGIVPWVLIFFSFASCVWSSNPIASFKTVAFIFFGTLCASIYCARNSIEDVFRLIGVSLIPLLFLSLFLIFFFPSYGIAVGTHEGAWQGAFDHKNALGAYTAICVSVYLGWQKIEKGFYKLILAGISYWLCLGSESLTSIFAASAAFILFIADFLIISTRFKRLMHFVSALVFIGLPAIVVFVPLYMGGLELEGKGAMFSGRGYIWEHIYSEFKSYPLWGHGFNDFKNKVYSSAGEGDVYNSIGFVAGTAHNGYLDMAHSLGLIGLLIIVFLLFTPLVVIKGNENIRSAYVYLVACSLFVNSFESKLYSPIFIYFIIIAFYFCVSNFKIKENTGAIP